MRRTLKILLYGDVDINIIDGSAVWLTSIANVLNKDKNIKVDLLLKSPIKNKALLSELQSLKNVSVINTYEVFKDYKFQNGNRMNVHEAIEKMELLDSERKYDCVIIRGFNLAKELMNSIICDKTIPYFTEFSHSLNEMTQTEKRNLLKIYNGFPYMFVQTAQMKEFLKGALSVDGEKFIMMSPMIPDYAEKPPFRNQNNSLVYAGKFAKDWYTEELLDAFEDIHQQDKTISLNVAGEKFQGELIPKKDELINRLKNQKGINWSGALSRKESLSLIKDSDLGVGWRSDSVDNDFSLELSTKILEYGQLGKPVLLRRTKMHENLLGKDYELFVSSESELIKKSLEVLYNRKLYRKTAQKVYDACRQFTFSEAYKRLKDTLWGFNNQKIKLLFAGHDLKFISMAMDYFKNNEQYEVRIDQWTGHSKHNEEYSKECLDWADVIFCEWGLGNAVWYSNNKKPDQKLFVRMHLQERVTEFPSKFNIENIDKIIAISPYIYEEFHRTCHIPREKMTMIYNMIDTSKFDKPKTVKSEDLSFNLGICGILPARKRLDRALNILEALWKKDKRYKLFVKSRLPQDVAWLMKREDEKKYYDAVFERINKEPWGKNVIFDEHGNDMDEWFQKIGYVLSTSDYESFHLAPMEGMAAGSVPIVLHWAGADTIYPREFLFENEDQIIQFVFSSQSKYKGDLKTYPNKHFSSNIIIRKIEQCINS